MQVNLIKCRSQGIGGTRCVESQIGGFNGRMDINWTLRRQETMNERHECTEFCTNRCTVTREVDLLAKETK
jgi:hypothetical protein